MPAAAIATIRFPSREIDVPQRAQIMTTYDERFQIRTIHETLINEIRRIAETHALVQATAKRSFMALANFTRFLTEGWKSKRMKENQAQIIAPRLIGHHHKVKINVFRSLYPH